jgi:ubiquitin thioesterase OTU1
MFSALGVVFEGGMEAAGKLRQVAADEIRRDAETWSEVVLG